MARLAAQALSSLWRICCALSGIVHGRDLVYSGSAAQPQPKNESHELHDRFTDLLVREIELYGARIRLCGGVDTEALQAVIDVLSRL